MDGNRFDSMTRALGQGRSRRGVVKGLAGAALGAVGLARFGAADAASNSACAKFCAQVFGANTTAAGQCTSNAAKGTGPCVACRGNAANYCNGGCTTDYQTDPINCGACGHSCNDGNACTTDSCSAGHCVYTPVTCDAGDACNAPAACDPATGCGSTTPLTGPSCDSGTGAGSGTCQSGSCMANQTCVGITPGTAQCASDTDCPSGQSCENGGCFTPCGDGGEVLGPCPSPSCIDGGCVCSESESGISCHDFGYGIGACLSNADCPAGSVCDFNLSLCTRPCPPA
jgi:Cys-rich repeat protein